MSEYAGRCIINDRYLELTIDESSWLVLTFVTWGEGFVMIRELYAWIQKKHNSIAFKLLLITSLLILCPVVVASTISYSQYTKNLEQKSAESNYQNIVQLSYSLNSYLDQLFQFSGTIYYNNDMMNGLESQASTIFGKLQKERTIEEQLSETFINARSDILSTYIVSNDEIYRAEIYNESIDYGTDYKAFSWYQEALKSNTAIYVPTHSEEFVFNPKHKVFSIVRRINSIRKTGELLGILKIDADYSAIQSICDKIQMGADGGLLIEDENESTIYSSMVNKDYNELNQLAVKNKDKYDTVMLHGKSYLMSSINIPESNWTIISLSSVEELNQSATQTRNVTFFIALLCSAIAIVILLFFIRSFLHPLLKIVTLMKGVQSGDLNVFFPEKRKDEIGYLGSSFNKMIRQINGTMKENTDLVKEVYETKLLQNEAQINALYSQIKPHFLFNTLNMISLLIRCNKTDVALDNIDKLSDLLRCMTHSDREITVKEEINLLNAYLSIQSTRYRDRLMYSIDIDERLYPFVIPALTFQPIVENTIVHGCEKQKEKTDIRITSQINRDTIVFRLEDNAGGINAETLTSLQDKIEHCDYESGGSTKKNGNPPTGKSGIGLLNVNKRLKMKFGDQYGLKIDSMESIGTCVLVVLPKPVDWEEKGNA